MSILISFLDWNARIIWLCDLRIFRNQNLICINNVLQLIIILLIPYMHCYIYYCMHLAAFFKVIKTLEMQTIEYFASTFWSTEQLSNRIHRLFWCTKHCQQCKLPNFGQSIYFFGIQCQKNIQIIFC